MRRIEKIAAFLLLLGIFVMFFGMAFEAFQVMASAWPSILLGLGFIALAVLLDGYKGSRFG